MGPRNGTCSWSLHTWPECCSWLAGHPMHSRHQQGPSHGGIHLMLTHAHALGNKQVPPNSRQTLAPWIQCCKIQISVYYIIYIYVYIYTYKLSVKYLHNFIYQKSPGKLKAHEMLDRVTEAVVENRPWLQKHLRIVAIGLARTAAIVVPHLQVAHLQRPCEQKTALETGERPWPWPTSAWSKLQQLGPSSTYSIHDYWDNFLFQALSFPG